MFGGAGLDKSARRFISIVGNYRYRKAAYNRQTNRQTDIAISTAQVKDQDQVTNYHGGGRWHGRRAEVIDM